MTIDIRLGRWQERLADVSSGSVRLALTSPPYDDARTYEGTDPTVDFGELAAFLLRVLAPGGVVAMVLDAPVRDGRQGTTPYRVICEWAALEGWRFLQCMAYGRHGAPGGYRGRFRKDHEPLLVFVRDGATHVCNKEAVSTGKRLVPDRGHARQKDGTMRHKGFDAVYPVHRGSVWWYGPVGHCCDASADAGHPATFAEAFALDAVRVWSNPGDLVCDPFSGSGTVARACALLDRSFVGAEAVDRYHAASLLRVAQPIQKGLFE